jgi:hypothetical protein
VLRPYFLPAAQAQDMLVVIICKGRNWVAELVTSGSLMLCRIQVKLFMNKSGISDLAGNTCMMVKMSVILRALGSISEQTPES